VSWCQKRISGLSGAREDNRGRHTDQSGWAPLQTDYQCPPGGGHLHHPPIFFYRPDALPAATPTVSKH